jgi:hypothetical protein
MIWGRYVGRNEKVPHRAVATALIENKKKDGHCA